MIGDVMSRVELDKTFTYNLGGTVSFGDLSENVVEDLFKDGRIASHAIERQIEIWFPDLTFVNKKGYDHIDSSGRKYDAKNFTKASGMNFMPSIMKGGGRSYDEEIAHGHAKEMIYIPCDIVDFPIVRVVFKKGSDLLKEYPDCSISMTPENREWLFG